MLTCTASIGLAVIKSAIRLCKNYKESIEVDSIDLHATNCRNCTEFLLSDAKKCEQSEFPFSPACETCANRIMHSDVKTVYVNEKNKYGFRHELKRNALLLFMYLHYLNPDDQGLVYVDIEDAASFLHCTERTIKNNLRLLNRHCYIDLDPVTVCPGYYKLFLNEYSTYFLPANNGGRGYCVLPLTHLEALVDMPDINSLRLAIRNLIPDTTFSKVNRIEKPYVEVQRNLPVYCSKKKIRSITSSDEFQNIFDVSSKKYFIAIKTKSKYDVSQVANTYKSDCRVKVLQLIDTLQKNAKQIKSRYKLVVLEEELNDICSIALKIPIKYILQALQQINENYILNHLKINNLGALVRTIATELFQLAV